MNLGYANHYFNKDVGNKRGRKRQECLQKLDNSRQVELRLIACFIPIMVQF